MGTGLEHSGAILTRCERGPRSVSVSGLVPVCVCVCVCVRACVRTCVRACVCSVRVRVLSLIIE